MCILRTKALMVYCYINMESLQSGCWNHLLCRKVLFSIDPLVSGVLLCLAFWFTFMCVYTCSIEPPSENYPQIFSDDISCIIKSINHSRKPNNNQESISIGHKIHKKFIKLLLWIKNTFISATESKTCFNGLWHFMV